MPDSRAWTAATMDAPSMWSFCLSPKSRQALWNEVAPAEVAASLTEVRPSPALRSLLEEELNPVRSVLEQGRGFVLQDGAQLRDGSPQSATLGYWLIGQCLGTPVVQNVQGTLLYDVRDTGQSVEYGARFSVTNADSSYHTDNSFGERVTDWVGLLCLRPARSGGINHLVSAWSVAEILARECPDLLAVLAEPFPVDRRGGFREGESPIAYRPVLERRGDDVLVRYLRYWIHAGAEKAGKTLTERQVRALDALDEVISRPELRVEFSLQAGQTLWMNNRWLLHSRTAFQDFEEPERRRHLVRLWLESA